MVGHIEKLSEIIGHLVEAASGEQYRCGSCGAFGPKFPKLGLKDAADVLRLLKAAITRPGEAATVVPIQVIVAAGGPIVPYRREQVPSSGLPLGGPRKSLLGQPGAKFGVYAGITGMRSGLMSPRSRSGAVSARTSAYGVGGRCWWTQPSRVNRDRPTSTRHPSA